MSLENNCIMLIVVLSLFLGYFSTSGTKSQWIRLVDVFIIGPLMIYLGANGYKISNNLLYLVLMFFGGTTITYNLRNYLVIARY
jgi:hypothetical protein